MTHLKFIETGIGVIPVQELEPSKSLEELDTNGYLYLPQFLPKSQVSDALETIKTTQDKSLMDDQNSVKQNQILMQVLEHPKLFELMDQIYSREYSKVKVATLPFKWIRRVKEGLHTGLHCDYVYVGHIHPKILTIWIPLCDIPLERGSMVISPQSHTLHTWKTIHDSYDHRKLENGTDSGWLDGQFDFEPEWKSRNFEMGDVVVLHPRVMHMTAVNTSGIRYSVDTRWIPIE